MIGIELSLAYYWNIMVNHIGHLGCWSDIPFQEFYHAH
jgi:hypothetical protein